jgi:peptidoglycan-N-acetylglucosamine deacetylase
MEKNNDDEGEPSKTNKYLLRFSLLVIIYFAACGRFATGPATGHQPAKKAVTVAPVKTPAVKKQKKKIYLTFDDGPNKGTQNVLRIVEQEQIPVSFFIVGEHVYGSAAQQATWDSLQSAPNIELCNHSYSHAWHNKFAVFYQYPDSVVKDFQRTADSLRLNNTIVRTPGRNIWRVDTIVYTDLKKSHAAADSLKEAGFTVMGWDLEWHYDAAQLKLANGADQLLAQVDSVFTKGKTRTPDNLVLLAHDQVYQDAADSLQLHQLIRKLKQRGEYEFAFVSHYPALKKDSLDAAIGR